MLVICDLYFAVSTAEFPIKKKKLDNYGTLKLVSRIISSLSVKSEDGTLEHGSFIF